MKKIIHIITGLGLGGAEKMLYNILLHTDRDKYSVEVISLTSEGYYKSEIEKLNIKVTSIDTSKVGLLKSIILVRKHVVKIDVLQTWMYHSDLIGYLSTRFMKKKPKLIWGIRRTNLNKNENKKRTLLIAKINSIFSPKVNKVISCSHSGRKSHIEYGYSKANIDVIPNGFDLSIFKKQKVNATEVKESLNIPTNHKIIINVGRWNIAKDHENLIKSFSLIEKEYSDIKLLLVGPNISKDNVELMNTIKKYEIKNIKLLGPRDDIPTLFSISDLYVSSSRSEGFPNVIGEAMACELPCIVTEAGDSKYIVGSTGEVVDIENSEQLSAAILNFFELHPTKREELGIQSRKRIEEKFEIKKVVKMFEEHYI